MMPALADLVRGALGSARLGNLILVGFSEGCQAVRAYLAAGEVPSAVLAIDGAHASAPPDLRTQIQPWRDFFDRARARRAHAIITATRIPTTNYLSTATMLPILTGFPPAPKVAAPAAAAGFAPVALITLGLSTAATLEQHARGRNVRLWQVGEAGDPAWEVMGGGAFQKCSEGWLQAQQWPGGDAAAHVQQAAQVMPIALGEVFVRLANGPIAPFVRGYSAGDPPPIAPVGPYTELPPGLTPTNPKPGRVPDSPAPAPPPAPSSSSGGGGAGAVLLVLAAAGLGAVAVSRR